MNDLSNWVRRDGLEIVLGPEKVEGLWQYIYRTEAGRFGVTHVGEGGMCWSTGVESVGDLIPPEEWVYVVKLGDSEEVSHALAWFGNDIYRHKKGDPTTMELYREAKK